MTTEVTGSDRLISLGLRARVVLERFGHHAPSGQLRDEHGVSWRWSDEADWNAGGSGHQIPDLSDRVTVFALLVVAESRRRVWEVDIYCGPMHADITLTGGGAEVVSESGSDLAGAVVKVLEAVG